MNIATSLPAYRFRVVTPNLHSITRNCESVVFDFIRKTITIKVLQTIHPKDFEEAALFAQCQSFTVEAAEGEVTGSYFEIRPNSLTPLSHELDLCHGSSTKATHLFVFSYTSFTTGSTVQMEPASPSKDPAFPTPQEVADVLDLGDYAEQVDLDDQQECRFTPDNPDTDSDGTPDREDRYPLDPTRQ